MNYQLMNGDLSYWEEMTERYFLAELTEQEEARLRRFLCSDEARDARFDEARATMSYLYVAQAEASPAPSEGGERQSPAMSGGRINPPLLWRRRGRLAIAVAASLLVAFLGWHQYRQYNVSSVRMAGEDIEEADASLLMRQQMTAMFNPLDQ